LKTSGEKRETLKNNYMKLEKRRKKEKKLELFKVDLNDLNYFMKKKI
jgi:hypothetical protein